MHTLLRKHTKRFLPCMLVMLILCSIFTVNAGATTIIPVEEKQLFGAPDDSVSYSAKAINTDALKAYLRDELVKCPEKVDISSFNLEYTDANSSILSNIIYYESPELFHVKGLSMSISNGTIKTIIPKYRYTAQEYIPMYNACLTQANSILDGIIGNNNLSDVEKALLIHDRLAVHCEYDESVYTTGNVPDSSYIMYGTLAKGVSVCQGYAEAYYYLLEKVGIENRLCSSDALYHVWNIVTINGKEYHVDVTWDDPMFDKTGQVLHTNFLRSSNGMYETGHDAYDYDTSPTATTYDSYFWQDSETEFQLIGNEIYYIDNNAEAIKKYSNKSTVVACSDMWPASTSGHYWVGNFSRLSSDGTNLYYNTAKDVYKYNVSTGEKEKIWSPDLSANVLFRIYGFTYKDGYLICDINSTPNFEINDKSTYQQRLAYHSHNIVIVPGMAATCTEAGLTDGSYCSSCDAVLSEQEVIPALGHNWVDSVCSHCGIYCGDLSGDDEVDSNDAVHLLYHILIPDRYEINQDCDFNGDGDVDSNDAIYLLYHTLIPERYPLA